MFVNLNFDDKEIQELLEEMKRLVYKLRVLNLELASKINLSANTTKE